MWTAEDKEKLVNMVNKEIDVLETYLGRYAVLQKRNTVATVLDFTDKEWESLKTLKEADVANRSNTVVTDEMDNNVEGSLTEDKMIGGESDVVKM